MTLHKTTHNVKCVLNAFYLYVIANSKKQLVFFCFVENIQLVIQLSNPLHVPLTLTDLSLLWRFRLANLPTEPEVNNENCDETVAKQHVQTFVLKELTLEARQTTDVSTS